MPSDLQRELLELFGQEAESRLTQLSDNLLELEEHGASAELVGSLFRDAHTLKGSAAVVGLGGFSSVAHRMEDLLGQLRDQAREPSAELVDGLLVAVDGLRRLLPALLRGADLSAETDSLGRQLAAVAPSRAVAELPGPSPAVSPGPPPDQRPPVGPEPPRAHPSRGGPAPERPAPGAPHGPSVRVPLERLEDLAGLVGESAAAHLRLGRLLSRRLGPTAVNLPEVRDLGRSLNSLQEKTMRVRMVPIATVAEPLRRAAREVARSQGKNVRWVLTGEETELDRSVLDRLSEALLHLVRNAVDHGVEGPAGRAAAGKPATATVAMHATQVGSEVVVTVRDDGRGIDLDDLRRRAGTGHDLDDAETLQLLFRAGFSTASEVTDISGRGVGLDVVKVAVEALRGRVEVRSVLGAGSEFRLIVPITLAVLRCLLVEAGGRRFAIPMHSVQSVLGPGEPSRPDGGQDTVLVDNEPVALRDLGPTLGLGGRPVPGPVVVLAGLNRRVAFRVDRLLHHRDVVVKNLSPLLPRIEVLAGASVEPDGSVLLVLDSSGLIDRARRGRVEGAMRSAPVGDGIAEEDAPVSPPTILVVDDAVTVRTVERMVLERAGYQVLTAGDGIEALATLRSSTVDLVVTDIEMPRMDGLELTRVIRSDPRLTQTGIIMVTARGSEDDKRAGLEAGADAYVEKRQFDQKDLLSLIERMLGPSRGAGRA